MANIHKLTKQQMFNKAVLGVVRQGALSMRGRAHCRYRMAKDGKTLACGVGHLIADDVYTPSIEGAPAEAAFPGRPSYCDTLRADALMLALCFSGVDVTDKETVGFLDDIQSAHDCACDLQGYLDECRMLAHRNGLTMPRLPKQYA